MPSPPAASAKAALVMARGASATTSTVSLAATVAPEMSAVVSLRMTPTSTLRPAPATPAATAPATTKTSTWLTATTATDWVLAAVAALRVLTCASPVMVAVVSEFSTSTATAPPRPTKPPAPEAATARMSSEESAHTTTPRRDRVEMVGSPSSFTVISPVGTSSTDVPVEPAPST